MYLGVLPGLKQEVSDMDDETTLNVGALAASHLASTSVVIDTSVAAWSMNQARVRIRAGGQEYSGRLAGFDGNRLLLLDDLDVPTIIHLSSGVVITGPK